MHSPRGRTKLTSRKKSTFRLYLQVERSQNAEKAIRTGTLATQTSPSLQRFTSVPVSSFIEHFHSSGQ